MTASGLPCSTLVLYIDDVTMAGPNKQALASVLGVLARDSFQKVGVNIIKIQGHLPVKILGVQWSGNIKDILCKLLDLPNTLTSKKEAQFLVGLFRF